MRNEAANSTTADRDHSIQEIRQDFFRHSSFLIPNSLLNSEYRASLGKSKFNKTGRG